MDKQNKQPKQTYGFDRLISSFLDEEEAREAMFSGQCISYKLLLHRCVYDVFFPVHWDHIALNGINPNYDKLVSLYDRFGLEFMIDSIKNTTIQIFAAREIIGTNGGKKSVKRMKKRSSRIFREVKRKFKEGRYGNKDTDLYKALTYFHFAFRESFINVRVRLCKAQYDLLPDVLQATLNDGSIHLIRDLYIWDDVSNCFRLDRGAGISKQDLRSIQLAIAPYIFVR